MHGRYVPLSAPRRIVGDLMRFSMRVPRVTVQRHMNIARLRAARAAATPPPTWTALFTKAYALLAQETPPLRRAYVRWPWPHLYEYPGSIASIAFERDVAGEEAVLLGRIKLPESRPLGEIDALIRAFRETPVYEVPEFRRALRAARAPGPMRRLLLGFVLANGRHRANYFGTFQFSVYSGLGAESFNPLTPLTTLLNYGPIAPDGGVDVRILYDHRVMDGATVARALARFEHILNEALVEEFAAPPQAPTPADAPLSPARRESRRAGPSPPRASRRRRPAAPRP